MKFVDAQQFLGMLADIYHKGPEGVQSDRVFLLFFLVSLSFCGENESELLIALWVVQIQIDGYLSLCYSWGLGAGVEFPAHLP